MKFKNTSNAMKPSLISAKTNETLVSSFLTFVSKVINMVLPIKDVNDLQKELANDHLITKLYNQTHRDQQLMLCKELNLSDFYQPREDQKQGELMFIGAGALALEYASFHFL